MCKKIIMDKPGVTTLSRQDCWNGPDYAMVLCCRRPAEHRKIPWCAVFRLDGFTRSGFTWERQSHMSEPQSKNIFWTQGKVTAEQRVDLSGQSGCVVWLTGLSASGKSTIVTELERELFSQGRVAYMLDGDNTRHGLCSGSPPLTNRPCTRNWNCIRIN
jgi:hypothetical protein